MQCASRAVRRWRAVGGHPVVQRSRERGALTPDERGGNRRSHRTRRRSPRRPSPRRPSQPPLRGGRCRAGLHLGQERRQALGGVRLSAGPQRGSWLLRRHAVTRKRSPAAEQNRAELARRRGLDLRVVEPSIDGRSGRVHEPDRTGRYRKARPLRPARTAPAPAPRLVEVQGGRSRPAVQALMGRVTGMPSLRALSTRLAMKPGNDGLPVQGSPHPTGFDSSLRV